MEGVFVVHRIEMLRTEARPPISRQLGWKKVAAPARKLPS